MQIDVSFAHPIGPYSNPINRLIPNYCHVELSFHTTAASFKQQLVQHMESPNKKILLELKKRLDKINGKLIVCYYINWGESVSCRFLSPLIDNPYHRPPEKPVYDVVPLECSVDQMNNLTEFYLKNLGKPYDYFRAILCLFPYTLRDCNYDKYFCSQLVIKSLVKVGLCEEPNNPNHMTPNQVYNHIAHTLSHTK